MRRPLNVLGLMAASAMFAPGSLLATHISGVDISWECTGGNNYQITLNLFRDCSGIAMSSTQEIVISSDCGSYFTVTLGQGPGSGQEISQLCPPILPQSDCGSGGYPGMEAYNFQGTVYLYPPCDSWTIGWSDCCRNTSVNVPNSSLDDIYAEAVINTVTAPCNDSPVFTAQPIPFVCLGQPVNYNFGVYDPDGDSLVYTFIDGRIDAITSLSYGTGYSSTAPIPGIALDPNTGAVNFTPTITGNYIVVVQVEEYDDNGNLIGTVMRDMQFTVINCTNILPDSPLSLTNLTGDASQTGPTSVELCLGDQFCFDLVFMDGNANDSLTLTSNVDLVLPGATFMQTGVNPATATVCWTAVPGTASLASFTVTAEDNACPVTGLAQSTVWVTFLPTTQINVQDTILCFADDLAVLATGGNIFDWAVLSGPPIQVGVNFSCNPCADPIASPAATTVYEVTSDLNGQGCVNKDTLTVEVVPPFGFDAITIDDADCHGSSDGSITVEPWGTAGPPWTYELYAGGNLQQSQNTNGQAVLAGLTAGSYDLHLLEPMGCLHDTLLQVNEPDELIASTSDTTICLSTLATLSAQAMGGTLPYTFHWDQGLVGNGPHQVGPNAPTVYNVFATDDHGCVSASVAAAVDLYPPLLATALAPDSICIDAGTVMSVQPGGGIGAPYFFDWTEPGLGTIGTDDTLNYTPNGQVNTFIVTVADGCGTPPATDTVQVAWYPPPVPLLAPDRYQDCFPATFTFTNLTPPGDVGADCIWNFGDGQSTTGCGQVTNTYANVGCYDVTLTVFSPEGCPGTATFPDVVCARPYPVADFDHIPLSVNVLDPEVAFLNRSIDDVSWAWSFGPLCIPDSAFVPDPIVLFPETDEGDYPVWLHVTNIYGCPDSVMKIVHIDGVFSLYVPNAFTPDDDGVNDLFGPLGLGLAEADFDMTIFDRWGQAIFRTNKLGEWWDGSLANGSPAMPGVYVWQIEFLDKYRGFHDKARGHVTLVR
ncbi:MAG: gliding motility-associated C-terminal domain-containing protein [Flavobacteriales bacterium]|nr:gliding motility-associated C-terminal domain-containing protein [Flavobacteriales bacterium]MCB9167622.1 gliding motility-associated C-terminal domain-containing protein [Flavobacteriales bacterium]